MQVTEFNLATAVGKIKEHLEQVQEPQYKSVFIMRLFQICIEMIKPKEATDIAFKLFQDAYISKQQIRRALARLFWKFSDILIDYPKGHNVLGQILAYLKLRNLVTGKIVTQIPEDVRLMLLTLESFKECFAKEILAIDTEAEYRTKIVSLLKHYYYNFDLGDICQFFDEEVPKRGWEIFNYLFIKKAVDIALD